MRAVILSLVAQHDGLPVNPARRDTLSHGRPVLLQQIEIRASAGDGNLVPSSHGCKVPYAGVAVNEVAILRKGAGSDMEADLVALRPMSATALDVKRREW